LISKTPFYFFLVTKGSLLLNHSNNVFENENPKNFRFTAGGGYSYWLGKLMKTGDKK
jgi:hypothetical protein